MFLKRPFQLKNLDLRSNVFCAPLAGCSDVPFRRISAKYLPGLMYCEMVKMDPLVRGMEETMNFLEYEEIMRPIGAQICGSKPELAAASAKIIENLGFDVVDFNCGCPVDKVTKDGSGSAMLKNPSAIGDIISNMVSAVNIPVTVKIRAGWDEHSIVAPEVTRIAEEAGATAICIHGRTREQGFSGPADWDYIRECKRVAKNIKVIANGDIFDAESAEGIFKHTGCDAILISRGLMGQPWIIEDIYRRLEGRESINRNGFDYRDVLLQHMEHIVSWRSVEKKAVLDMRRVGCWFLRNGRGARELRQSLNHCQSIEEIRTILNSFAWETADFSTKKSI